MHRLPLRAIMNLMPATRAIRYQQRICIRLAHRRQERQLRHFHRYLYVVLLVAEAAGHAAAGGFDQFYLEVGDQAQHFLDRAYGFEGFLMAVPVEQGFLLWQGFELGLEAAGVDFAGDEFFEGEGLEGEAAGSGAQVHGEEFVA